MSIIQTNLFSMEWIELSNYVLSVLFQEHNELRPNPFFHLKKNNLKVIFQNRLQQAMNLKSHISHTTVLRLRFLYKSFRFMYVKILTFHNIFAIWQI